MTSGEAFEDIYYTSRDGLRLHARRYPASGGTGRHARPALCLPGLTRNGRDFHDLAVALSKHSHTPRTVYTLRLPRPRAVRFRSRLAQLHHLQSRCWT